MTEEYFRLMNADEICAFFSLFKNSNVSPQTELYYTNSFTLLIAVVLSAQATDKGVNKATQALFPLVSRPEDVVQLGMDKLLDYIKTIGLYPSKAKNIMALSHKLIKEHGGQVPADRHALESLPGVGRKTANVILNVAFGQPTIAVDTHIFRLCRRTGLAPGKTPRAVEDLLMEKVPAAFLQDAHHWLVLHGRYICTARQPKCKICPVQHLCQYKMKNL